MTLFSNFVYLLLPLLATSIITTFEPLKLNNATFLNQSFYMYSQQTSSKNFASEKGHSYINLNIDISKIDDDKPGYGIIETAILSESDFMNIGYDYNNKHIVCCDAVGIETKRCSNPYRILFPELDPKKSIYKIFEFTGNKRSLNMEFDVSFDGKYYVVIGVCSPETSNMLLQGKTISMNPFGHLSGRMHSIINFTKSFIWIYTVLICMWVFWVFQYRKELMSIHAMITFVLCLFALSSILSYNNLRYLNSNGDYHYGLYSFYLVIYSVSRTSLRCLLFMIAKGLGVSVATLGSSFWYLIFLSTCYFINSVCCEYVNNHSYIIYENQVIQNPFSISAIVIDSVFFFFIIRNLFATIDDLRDKKQTSKLEIFVTIRNILIFGTVSATIYNLVFSYIVNENLLESMWKIQWVFTDGIWMLIHSIIISIVMYLWAPNEHSSDYADHHQISTDDRAEEEYDMPEVELQTSGGKVQVTSVDENVLKPMKL